MGIAALDQVSGDLSALDPAQPQETTTYAYDAAHRLLTRAYPDGQNDTFGYDPASRLTAAVSARYGNTVGRSYDAAGRLTAESLTLDGTTHLVGYGYDDDNRLTTLTHPDGTVVTQGFTARHQLDLVTLGGSPVATRAQGRSLQ